MPTRIDWPVCGSSRVRSSSASGWWRGLLDSIRVRARARTATSPARTPAYVLVRRQLAAAWAVTDHDGTVAADTAAGDSSRAMPSRSASTRTSLAAASPITVPGPNTAAAPASYRAG